jgi:hypothetical protein
MSRGHNNSNREPMHTELETVEDEDTYNEADEEYTDEDVEDVEEEDEHDAAVRRAWGM